MCKRIDIRLRRPPIRFNGVPDEWLELVEVVHDSRFDYEAVGADPDDERRAGNLPLVEEGVEVEPNWDRERSRVALALLRGPANQSDGHADRIVLRDGNERGLERFARRTVRCHEDEELGRSHRQAGSARHSAPLGASELIAGTRRPNMTKNGPDLAHDDDQRKAFDRHGYNQQSDYSVEQQINPPSLSETSAIDDAPRPPPRPTPLRRRP
jgi:hypothetical protein